MEYLENIEALREIKCTGDVVAEFGFSGTVDSTEITVDSTIITVDAG
jgi:hypothetical protein